MIIRQTALILRVNKVKDNDAYIQVITEEKGLCSIYAYNILSKNSKRKSLIEIMSLVNIMFTEKNNSLVLNEIKQISNLNILKNPQNFYRDTYIIAEILSKMIQSDQEDLNIIGYFIQLNNIKNYLETSQISIWLLFKIIEKLGYLPDISIDQKTGKKLDISKNINSIENELGFVNILNDEIPNPEFIQIIKIINFAAKCEKISEFIKLNINKNIQEKIWNISLDWIECIIGNKIKSRKIL